MCLSTVWTAERQPVCKNVASVTQKDGQLVFTDIMGIPTVVNGHDNIHCRSLFSCKSTR